MMATAQGRKTLELDPGFFACTSFSSRTNFLDKRTVCTIPYKERGDPARSRRLPAKISADLKKLSVRPYARGGRDGSCENSFEISSAAGPEAAARLNASYFHPDVGSEAG
jgi:hypothetical protein